MTISSLNINNFEKSLAQLEQFLERAAQALKDKNQGDYELFRTGGIQAFEYCYEIAMKLLRKHIEMADVSTKEARRVHFADMLRIGAEFGFIKESTDWLRYREKRNKTAHTYSENIAEEVFAILPDFLSKAKVLMQALPR